jgi:hypothetical protein
MKHRGLTDGEIAYADRIFGEAIDYHLVRVTRGSALAFFSATALGNTINLQAAHFEADTLNLSDGGRLVLVHELAHVWQYQHFGLGYIASSLRAQAWAWLTTGSRRAAYDWRKAQERNLPWPRWNAEQQAQCFSDYNQALQRQNTGSGDPDTIALVQTILSEALHQDSSS